MIPAAFDYPAPARSTRRSRPSASAGAKVIAGGQSLLPLLKLRLAAADTLVDIGRLAEPRRHALHGGRRSSRSAR